MNKLNTFSGKNALLNFHNPAQQPYVPLVELPEELNPFVNENVRIYVKLMNMLPLANVKSVPAFNMLKKAKEKGTLDNVNEIVEASSGNTVLSLTVIAKALGIHKTKSFLSHEISPGKLKLLRLFGTTPVVYQEPICADPNDPESRLHKARVYGKNKKVFNPDQYSNPENPNGHVNITGKQIWEQTEGNISIFVSSLGTTGTVIGTSRFLKSQNKKVFTLGTVRKPNNLVPGLRTINLLREIEHDWKAYVDEVELVGTVESYQKSLDLIRYGLFVGPSSGFGLAGLLNYLEKRKGENTLDELRNPNGQIVCTFIACDTPSPYIDDYFKYLPESVFPKIENEELLASHTVQQDNAYEDVFSVSPEEAFEILYPYTIEDMQKRHQSGIDIQLHPGKFIIDVSPKEKFDETRLHASQNIPLEDLKESIISITEELRGFAVYVICQYGSKSEIATKLLQENGIHATNIEGGLMEWTNAKLPKADIEYCQLLEYESEKNN